MAAERLSSNKQFDNYLKFLYGGVQDKRSGGDSP
jgi:hypothetical protein